MDILERIVQLRNDGIRFAIATVVSRKAPVSSQLGDKAIILEDGHLEGFIGGACSREIVRKQAQEVLRLGRPRLLRISPDPVVLVAADRDEICVPMTCASEGAVDVYIEPQLEKKRLLIAGASPIAFALAKQARLQEYDVSLVYEAAEEDAVSYALAGFELERIELSALQAWLEKQTPSQKAALEVVLASMGHYDEEGLLAVLKARPRYLGLVSSQKRGQKIFDLLKDMGLSEAQLAGIRNPAGLDLGAKTPNEVAISILAEMIMVRRQLNLAGASPASQEAKCPVCGMTVEISLAKYSADYLGQTYYFCCPGCRHHFLKDPENYLQGASL